MPRKKPKSTAGEAQPGRPVSLSCTEMVEFALPQDANVHGSVLGGRVMHLVDIAAAIAGSRHSHSDVVTASVDHLDFRNPIHVGELIILKASVNRVFNTSMEVGVKVFSENPLSGERKHTTSAYLTFVALDEAGNPQPVPQVVPETPEDERRFRQALARRKLRLSQAARAAEEAGS